MDFSWAKAAWKGVRGGLLMALGIALLAFLGTIDTSAEVTALGVPGYLVPLIVALVGFAGPFLRNVMKKKYGLDLPATILGKRKNDLYVSKPRL